ncbi:hypothetical protein Prudu_004799 [Prunus dulcis]|uniref:Uncharacterized protein n=1 Tax=Prunus dulcis TaxID=3755 RepID=A0A4Y1QW55_PRUDU|nr:hypothetical protein Prudu_004799 [Prunus dulcis]
MHRWTSCGFDGIYLNGIYDIPEWFKIVNHVDNIVFFEVPQRIMGRTIVKRCAPFARRGPSLHSCKASVDFVRVKKTGVHLEWDKVMKENMDNLDPHLYDLETNRDFLAVKPYLDFLGGIDDEARPSHDASVPGDQLSAIDEESAVEDDPSAMAIYVLVCHCLSWKIWIFLEELMMGQDGAMAHLSALINWVL